MIEKPLPGLERFSNLTISHGNEPSIRTISAKETSREPIPYPRASLLGLPTELRLLIYTHLAESVHLHIDYPPSWVRPWSMYKPSNTRMRFCHAPDTTFRQLCAKPMFSGLAATEDLCHQRNENAARNKHHPFALRATCKRVYEETRGILQIGITVQADYTSEMLKALRPDTRRSLVRLTILDIPGGWVLHGAVAYLSYHAWEFPSLRSVAVQTRQPHYKFCVKRPRRHPLFHPESTWDKLWFVNALYKIFDKEVTVVLEAWVVVRAGYRENQSAVDEMVVIRGVVRGSRETKRSGNSEFEMRREAVVAPEKSAPWKEWWLAEDFGYGKKPRW